MALALVGILILAAATVVIVTVRQHRQAALAELRPSGIPHSIPTSIANLMTLSPLPAKPAPGFTLGAYLSVWAVKEGGFLRLTVPDEPLPAAADDQTEPLPEGRRPRPHG